MSSADRCRRRRRAPRTASLPKEHSELNSKRTLPVLWFTGRFCLILVVVGVAYTQITIVSHAPLDMLTRSTATVCGSLLAVVSDRVSYNDRWVTCDAFSVEIIDECTGAFEALIFISAVLAFGTSVRKKLSGLVLGLPLIYFVNLLRVCFLVVVGAQWPNSFQFFHGYLGQGTLIFVIGIIWLIWLRMVVTREPKTHVISG